MSELLGPANAPGAASSRPADARTFGSDDRWFKDCTDEATNDGTELTADFFNSLLAQARSAIRGMGAVLDNTSDDMLLHAIQLGMVPFGVDSGAADALVVTFSPAIPSYTRPRLFSVVVAHANATTTPTVNVNALGARTIVDRLGAALPVGELQAGVLALFQDDGTNIRLMTPRVASLKTVLTTALTYYVNPVTGSDGNDGRTAGTAWATLNHAYSWLQQNVDFNGQTVTISCAFPNNPTNYASFVANGRITGVFSPAQLQIVGDTTNKHCVISAAVLSAGVVQAQNGALFQMTGFGLVNTGTQGSLVQVTGGAQIEIGYMNLGAAAFYGLVASGSGSQIRTVGPVLFTTATYVAAIFALANATIDIQVTAFTFIAITASTAVLLTTDVGCILVGNSSTFTGAVTGPKYYATSNSVIETVGAQATPTTAYIPGSVGGSTATGGQII